jgi:MFS family permease
VRHVQFAAVEIPSNLVLKRIGSVWVAGLVTGFGAVAIGTAFVKSYSGLIVTRVFLGLAEGGTLARVSAVLVQISLIN